MTPGLALWSVAFQKSPIILVNGLANFMPGGMLPIIAITEAVNFPLGLLTGGRVGLDEMFADFAPAAGASLISQEIAKYPFANQAVAANATITMPLSIPMIMRVPAKQRFGYWSKFAIMMALAEALKLHNSNGGLFHVATPSYLYTDCILRDLRDVSGGESSQPQHTWQWDFEKPLITLSGAQRAQNSLMSKLTSQTEINGTPTWSGLSPNVGTTQGVAGVSVVPAQSGSVASGITGGSAAP